MKKLFFGTTAFVVISLVFFSCPDSSGSSNTGGTDPVIPGQKTIIVFDNTYGICTAVVYDDYRRRDMDKIAEVPAGTSSAEFEWTPSVSTPFYFAYRVTLKDINDFTVDFVPRVGSDQKAVRIDANKKTVIPILVLDEAVTSQEQVLSTKSYLTILNNSLNSFQLHRGVSMVRPDNSPNSGVVNSNERALYTVNPGRTGDFRLLVGIDYRPFPDTPERFEAGNFYSYLFTNAVSFNTEIPINLDNIDIQAYAVIFNRNGGSGTVPAAQIVRAASNITLPAGSGLTNGDRIFGGWCADPSGDGAVYSAGTSYTVTGDIILYARWYPAGAASLYTVAFNSAGGSPTASQSMLPGAVAIRPADPFRAGYAFDGWYGDSAAQTPYDFAAPVTESFTLYAAWTANKHTVTFHANGANGIAPAAVTVDYGFVITLPGAGELSKQDETFHGWNTDDSGEGTSYASGAQYTVTGDVTLFAVWTANKHTVTFHANGANGTAPAAVTVDYGSVITLPGAGELSKQDETFHGWNTEDDGTGTTYASGTQYTVTGDVTLFAMWVPEEPPPPPGIVIPQGGALIRVNTQTELEAIRSHIDDPAYNYGKNAYILQQDITLSGTWTPIGRVETVDRGGTPTGGLHAFSGNFYGNGHTIRNMVLPGGSIHYIGLFGYIEDALIQDVQVELGENVISVTNGTAQYIGIIAGAHKNSVIRNCGVFSQSGITVNNSSGTYHLDVAGISFGIYRENGNISSIIEDCYVAMDITVTNGGTHITACGITSRTNVVRNCYYIGNLTGTGQYAELFGVSFDSEVVEKNYSTGTITNNASSSSYTSTAGIGGFNSLSNCVTLIERINHVSGTNYARIQSSYGSATLTNNYAYSDMLLNGATVTGSNANSQNGLDKTAAELKQRSTYETGLGWDFANVWEMGPASYPFPILKWQNGIVKLPPGFSVIGSGSASMNVSTPAEFTSALSTIRSSSGDDFTITVTTDMNLSPQDLTLAAYRGKSITLRGNTSTRTISLSSQGSLFTVGADVELVLENIVLVGRSNNNASLVTADGSKLVLNSGGKVTGNKTTGITDTSLAMSGGVTIKNNAHFTMNGGEISGNATSQHGDAGAGGLCVHKSTFIMNGGKISNNTGSSTYSGWICGGILSAYSVFTMYNGEISDNSVTYTQFNGVKVGGIIIAAGSVFTMYDGKITRNTESGPGTRGWGAGGVVVYNRGDEMFPGQPIVNSSAFYMHGGEISANKSVSHTFSAGGVCITQQGDPGVFIKDGGIVYGTDEPDVSLRNTSGRANGAAVYATTDPFGANPKSRNASLYENDNFDSRVSGSTGGWE